MATITPEAVAPTSAHGSRSHWTLFLLLLVYTMSFSDRQMISILIPPIKEAFQVSDTLMGLLGGMSFALFYGILAVPFGRYADRANRRNFISVCAGIWSVMTFVCGTATGYWWLFLARIGVAVGEAGGEAPSFSMLADHYPPRRRGAVMSIFMLGPQFGQMVGLIGGGAIAFHFGWRAAFLWMGVPGVIIALLLRFTATEPKRGRWEGESGHTVKESLGVTFKSMWEDHAFRRLTVACLLVTFAGYGIGIWTPAFLVRSHGLTLESAGTAMGLFGAPAAVLGTLFSGWVSDRLGRHDARWRIWVPVIGCVIALIAALIFYASPSRGYWLLGKLEIPKIMVAFAVFSFATVFWTGPAFAVLAELIEARRRATTVAVFQLLLTLIGAGIGPLVLGAGSDALAPTFGEQSLRWTLVIANAVIYVLAIAAFVWTLYAYVAHRRARDETLATAR